MTLQKQRLAPAEFDNMHLAFLQLQANSQNEGIQSKSPFIMSIRCSISCNPEATANHPPLEVSSIMANPEIIDVPIMADPEITDIPRYLDKDSLLRKVDDAIRHNKLGELQHHVNEPVNLSKDPLLSVVIAHENSKLAIKLLKTMSAEQLRAKNIDEDTALHVAVAKGDERVVEALVEKNEQLKSGLLDARNKQREIPLHKAALFGQRRIFWKLVEHGSDVKAKRKDGACMLHCAIMGNAPELALEIAQKYPELMLGRNEKAVTPLQLMVTIPEAFPSQSHFGPFESLVYEWIPLEEGYKRHVEELSVHETSNQRYQDDECLPYVIKSQRKFPYNYATSFDMLELACIPVCSRIKELERLKKDHIQAMELVAYLAKDPGYWDFIGKGRTGEQIQIPSNACGIPSTPPDAENRGTETTAEQKDHTEHPKKNRWNESPLILGSEMGLHEFVRQILTVYPKSAEYRDTEGRNVLQVAIEEGQEKIVEIIASMASGNNPVLPSSLLSEIPDKTKNTILHLSAVKTGQENSPAVQMLYDHQWFERVKLLVRKDLEYSRNEEEKTAQELFNEKHKDMVEKGKKQLMEMGKTYLSLVAAVVFASSFSIPGEKDANNNPVFLHKTAFKVFSHAYVIGLSCAATALVLFLSLLTSPYRVQDFRRSLPTKYFFAIMSFSLSLVALLVAFTCNIYLNIYGGRKAETKDIVPLVCELTIFLMVCAFVLLYRGASFEFGSFMRRVWR